MTTTETASAPATGSVESVGGSPFSRDTRFHTTEHPSADGFRAPPEFVDHPWAGSLLYPWDVHRRADFFDVLRQLPPKQTFELLWALRSAEVARDKEPLLEQLQRHIADRLRLVPALAGEPIDDIAAEVGEMDVHARDIHTTFLVTYAREALSGRLPLIDWGKRSIVEEARQQGRGVVALMLHTHACETAATFFPQVAPTTGVIARASELRLPQEAISRFVPLPDAEVLLAPGPSVLLRCATVLRKNRIVAFPPEFTVRNDDNVVAIDFMGLKLRTPIGPMRLAYRMRSPTIVVTCRPRPGPVYSFDIRGPFHVNSDDDCVAMCQTVFDTLGELIRDDVAEWQGWFMLEHMLADQHGHRSHG